MEIKAKKNGRTKRFNQKGCTSLTQAPVLPATTLAEDCYFSMFKGCTSLQVSYTQTAEAQYEWKIPSPGTFTLDTTAPEPEVANVDFSRISKVNIQRIGETTGKMCDEMHFTLVPNCPMQAFKVCAYKDQTTAAAGSHEDTAIPTTGGSQNMSGSGLSSSDTIACIIKGADYETALGGAGESGHAADGLHYVVVYVQDAGGNWSKAASFAAN